ncbi:MAG: serine/threonine protein kinase [Candidatus Obscuribacterales bacterium]|nr:serine/threonine protein kinase [Candidatus Obscuribacterales bacterium]
MTNELWNSKVISSRYDYVAPLGSGGVGSVVKAKDKALDKFVAIKVIKEELSPAEMRRFQQEAKLAGRLEHPNIVSTLDFGVSETNRPYLVLEYLAGESLSAIVRRKPLELPEALYIFTEICRGMSYSHRKGILHRDLKPSNVIVGFDENLDSKKIKIVDFGLAKLKDADQRLTCSGASVGTPLYSSPEQSEGRRDDIDERSDIYSMGCLMYKCLTGRSPFHGENALETLMLQKSETAPPLRDVTGTDFPDALERTIQNCIKVDPNERIQSFSALEKDLESIFIDSANLFETPSVVRVEQPMMDNPRPSVLTFAIIASVVLVGSIVLFQQWIVQPAKVEKRDFYSENVNNAEWTNQYLIKHLSDGWVTIHRFRNDSNLDFVRPYKKIDVFDASESSLTGEELAVLSDSEIHDLNLNSCRISDAGIKQLAKVRGLQRLEIMGPFTSDISDLGLQPLAAAPGLRKLRYGGRKLTERSIEVMKGSQHLDMLEIGHLNITERGIESLLSVPKLQSVCFENCTIQDSAYDALRQSKKIGLCELAQKNVSAHEIEQLLSLPVSHLNLKCCTLLPSVLMKVKGDKRFGSLGVISPGITRAQRAELVEHLPKKCRVEITSGNSKAFERDEADKNP